MVSLFSLSNQNIRMQKWLCSMKEAASGVWLLLPHVPLKLIAKSNYFT